MSILFSINFYCFTAHLTLQIVQAIAEYLIGHKKLLDSIKFEFFRTLFINFLEQLTKT